MALKEEKVFATSGKKKGSVRRETSVEEQPNTKPKQGGDKNAVDIVKSVRQLSCVSQDTEPPESAAISWKGTKVLGPIRRVRFTKATQRHADIRENKGPSLGKMQVKLPHRRNPYAVKFEDRSPGGD